MVKKVLTFAILIICSFSISFAQSKSNIPFIQAKNYFVKNSYKMEEIKQSKILSQKEFDEIFGMACLMGNEGKPTVIDFNKQFVIIIVNKETNNSTELFPISLKKEKKNKLIFDYQIKTGMEQSFVSQSCLIIIVDKKYKNYTIDFKSQSVE
jgi:hypothetical protein